MLCHRCHDADTPVSSGTLRGMELDHVLIAVADLTAAATTFVERFGLASVEGGRHPAWGTANRIVPLGSNYLELVAVVDEAVAAESPFAQWVREASSATGRPLGWAVRTDELDGVAERLGLDVSEGSRMPPTGDVLRWRSAGVEQAIAYAALPFFIEWKPGTALPGTMPITHPAAPVAISQLDLQGDRRRIDDWVADGTLPIAIRDGLPSVAAVRLTTASGDVILRAD